MVIAATTETPRGKRSHALLAHVAEGQWWVGVVNFEADHGVQSGLAKRRANGRARQHRQNSGHSN